MTGGGRYEHEVSELRKKIQAHGVIVAVFHGDRGDGFEVQIPPQVAHLVPKVLREIADKMEADVNFLTTQQAKG